MRDWNELIINVVECCWRLFIKWDENSLRNKISHIYDTCKRSNRLPQTREQQSLIEICFKYKSVYQLIIVSHLIYIFNNISHQVFHPTPPPAIRFLCFINNFQVIQNSYNISVLDLPQSIFKAFAWLHTIITRNTALPKLSQNFIQLQHSTPYTHPLKIAKFFLFVFVFFSLPICILAEAAF